MHLKPDLSASYSHFLLTSGQMTSLPGHFRSREVTWGHLLSRNATTSELQPCRSRNAPRAWLVPLQPLLGDFRPRRHFRSRDVTRGHFLLRECHLL